MNAVSAAAQNVTPSVVTIAVTSGGTGGTGSGIILDTEGDVPTNAHVATLDGRAQTGDRSAYQRRQRL
jgi:putative serine protease PepD